MRRNAVALREETIRVLDDLPQDKQAEVLDFALFLQKRADQGETGFVVKAVPASTLDPLIGIMSIGGDALEDSERIWDESEP